MSFQPGIKHPLPSEHNAELASQFVRVSYYKFTLRQMFIIGRLDQWVWGEGYLTVCCMCFYETIKSGLLECMDVFRHDGLISRVSLDKGSGCLVNTVLRAFVWLGMFLMCVIMCGDLQAFKSVNYTHMLD